MTKDFLRRDISVECGTSAHDEIVAIAVMLVLVWPLGMQLLFIGTLWCNRKALRRSAENSFTKALRFLSGGYKPQYFYCARISSHVTPPRPLAGSALHTVNRTRAPSHVFAGETVELARRLTCSGFVVLIPHSYIFMRIIMAFSVSIPILVATAVLKPFKNPEDNALALASQTILVVAFGCCALLRIVNEEDLTDEQKTVLVGFFSSSGVFLVLGLCCLGFLVMLTGTYVYKINELFQKHIRKTDDSMAQESSTWMLVGATFAGLTALTVGGVMYGPVGGILGATIFFSVGGAGGSICYSCVHKKRETKTHTVLASNTMSKVDTQSPSKSESDSFVKKLARQQMGPAHTTCDSDTVGMTPSQAQVETDSFNKKVENDSFAKKVQRQLGIDHGYANMGVLEREISRPVGMEGAIVDDDGTTSTVSPGSSAV